MLAERATTAILFELKMQVVPEPNVKRHLELVLERELLPRMAAILCAVHLLLR
jgi:hypothetical protein